MLRDPKGLEGFDVTTELHEAVKGLRHQEVRRLLSMVPDLNKTDVDLYTPLHRAVDGGDAEMVQLILGAKGDPNAAHPALDGWTPLHLAAWRDFPKVVELLLNKEADPGALDWYGQSPLDWAGGNSMEEFEAARKRKEAPSETPKPEEKDAFAQLRSKCVMEPSAIHLANIERCLKASDDFGIDQGAKCEQFDWKAGEEAAESKVIGA